ncbi:MAG: hypothetical protein JST47_05535 [Bacteroidetes bacterium]|nr:hypothetical protein [Bacteroidota bacterium]
MKKIIPEKKTSLQFCLTVLAALFMMVVFSSANVSSGNLKKNCSFVKDSIFVNKLSVNKNYSIRFSSGDLPRKLLITINKEQKKNYHFYMFDTDGVLKAQIDIPGNENISFVNIEKGNYYYEILCDEEKIEVGKLMVR